MIYVPKSKASLLLQNQNFLLLQQDLVQEKKIQKLNVKEHGELMHI